MKTKLDLTTLLGDVAKTTLEKMANSPAPTGQKNQQESARKEAPSAEPCLHAEEPSSQTFKSIGSQLAATVTEGLSREIDKKVQETVNVGERAIDRQRQIALREMQTLIEIERTKAVEELRKTASSVSNKVLMSAALIGCSLLLVAAALFFHK